MTFLDWLKGVGVTLSGLVGSCYGDAWNISFLGPCQEATDHLSDCLNVSTACSGDCGGDEVACEGPTACAADCINEASCDALRDAFSGAPSEASQAFLDCAKQCAAESGTKD